jgi:hypothetical protein
MRRRRQKSARLEIALSNASFGQKLLIRTLMMLTLLIALAPAIYFLSLAVANSVDKIDLSINGVATTAIVRSATLVSNDENNDYYDVVVTFQTKQGQPQEVTLQKLISSDEKFAIGSQLPILYKPDQSGKAVRNDSLLWLAGIIQALPLLLLSLVCMVVGIIFWISIGLTLIFSLVGPHNLKLRQ